MADLILKKKQIVAIPLTSLFLILRKKLKNKSCRNDVPDQKCHSILLAYSYFRDTTLINIYLSTNHSWVWQSCKTCFCFILILT